LIERQDALLAQLTQIANDGFSKAKEEWEKNLVLWGTDLPSFLLVLVLSPSLLPVFLFLLLLFVVVDSNIYPDKRQEKLRTEAAEASTGTGSAGPTRHPTEEMDVDGGNQPSGAGGGTTGGDAAEGGKDGKDGKDHGQHPPAKRYRLTDTMKSIVWELVLLSNECCRLENEKKSVFNYIYIYIYFELTRFFFFFILAKS
jgi:hypothetical protein